AAVQEGELAKALRKNVEAEGRRLEHEAVGIERDLRSALVGHPGFLDGSLGVAPMVALEVDLPALTNLHLEQLGKRVDDGHADTMEATGDLVRRLVELPAGVQLRHHDLGGGNTLGGMHADRDASAVVLDGDAVVDVDRDRDAITFPGERLVDRVVDNLEDQVVET